MLDVTIRREREMLLKTFSVEFFIDEYFIYSFIFYLQD